MSTARPFVSRRRRPCSLGKMCAHDGTVRPGDVALRVKPHAYVHVADVEHVTKMVTELLPVIRDAFQTIVESVAAAYHAIADVFVPWWIIPDDALPYDLTPDECWRCDAAPAADDVGLCSSCRDDLVAALH